MVLNEELKIKNSQSTIMDTDTKSGTEFIFSRDAEADKKSSSKRNSNPVKSRDLKIDD